MAGLGRKVFTAGDVLTASDVQSYLMDQTVMNFAGTAARSSAIATPTDGMVAVLNDSDQLVYYNGSAWGTGLPFSSWAAYTPTFSGFTLGNGTLDFAFTQIGKTVHVRGACTLGTTSVMNGPSLDLTLPVTSAYGALGFTYGHTSFWSGATVFNGSFISIGGTGNGRVLVYSTSNPYSQSLDITSTVPFTWASGRQFFLFLTYEAA